DLALHDVDVMRFVLGLEVARVFGESRSDIRTPFEDAIGGLIRFEGDGPIGLIDVNWLTPKKVRDLSVLGDRGLFVADYGDALAAIAIADALAESCRTGLPVRPEQV